MSDAEFPRYTIVIPAYNEESRITQPLIRYAEEFTDSEILVVLNGCTDRTAEKVRNVAERYAHVVPLDIAEPLGKGGAIRVGFHLARANAIGFVDADGSTPPEELRRLFEHLHAADAVIGSRWHPDSIVDIAQPIMRRVASRCFNLIVRILLGLSYSDTQCGAKVFRKDALKQVLSNRPLKNLLPARPMAATI